MENMSEPEQWCGIPNIIACPPVVLVEVDALRDCASVQRAASEPETLCPIQFAELALHCAPTTLAVHYIKASLPSARLDTTLGA